MGRGRPAGAAAKLDCLSPGRFGMSFFVMLFSKGILSHKINWLDGEFYRRLGLFVLSQSGHIIFYLMLQK